MIRTTDHTIYLDIRQTTEGWYALPWFDVVCQYPKRIAWGVHIYTTCTGALDPIRACFNLDVDARSRPYTMLDYTSRNGTRSSVRCALLGMLRCGQWGGTYYESCQLIGCGPAPINLQRDASEVVLALAERLQVESFPFSGLHWGAGAPTLH